MDAVLLVIHACATWMMIGVIWFVQGVYAPLYNRMEVRFTEQDKKDLRHLGYLIGPIYLLEGITAIILAFSIHNWYYKILALTNLCLLALIWGITAIFHKKQRQTEREYRLPVIRLHHIFLDSNWIRAIIWNIRGIIVILMVFAAHICL